MIKKILLSFFLLFTFNISNASPSDCSQLVGDGQRDCFASNVYYTGIYGGNYISLQSLLDDYAAIMCGNKESCSLKTSPGYPSPCVPYTTGQNCSDYTQISPPPNSSVFDGPVVVLFYNSAINKWQTFSQGGFLIKDTCPSNVGISKEKIPNGLRYGYLCKPSYPTKAVYCEDNSNGTQSSCTSSQKGQASVGKPVNLSDGSMSHTQVDFSFNNSLFSIQRFYNSSSKIWTFNYSRQINYLVSANGEYLTLTRDSGQSIIYKKDNGNWINITPNNLGQLINNSGSTPTNLSLYQYIDVNGNLESYDSSGQLIKISSLNGKNITISYTHDESNNIDYKNITDQYNNKLIFKLETNPGLCNSLNPQITNIKFYQNEIEKLSYDYVYNNVCSISSVQYPDLTSIQYSYSSAPNPILTNEIDQNGNNFIKWTYTSTANANKGYRVTTTHGLGISGTINKNTFTYPNATTITKTDALSNVTTINSVNNTNGTYAITDYATGICSDCDGFQGKNVTYDSNGNVRTYSDFNNNQYQNTYDSQSRLVSKKEAVGTSLEKETLYTWHLGTRLLSTQTQPVSGGQMVTEYLYDDTYDANNILIKSLLKQINVTAPNNDGTTNTTTKTWKYYYDTFNNVIKIENPRYIESNGIINDKLDMTYLNGKVSTVTNGKNQTITLSDYNSYGTPSNIQDASGKTTQLTYDSMGRILTSTFASSEVTSFEYDNVGQITKITSPTNTYQKLYYDTAHRLNKIEDYNQTNTYLGKTEFTLDNMSNLTAVSIYDATNVQLRLSTAQYDNKNRLYKTLGALNQTNTYLYDGNSNPVEMKDPLNNSITSTYDALNRLSTITNSDSGTMTTTYRPDNNVATVTDPKNLTTTYTYNGFGDLIKLQSPDTGTTEISYDIGSNPITYKDDRNQVSTYSYDELNRLISVNYNGTSSENVAITYDSCSNGIGLMCSITDSSGTRNYTYNDKGRISNKEYVNGTFSKTVSYNYNTNGQLTNMTYPSGKVVQYTYDNDNISSISYSDGTTTTNILNSATYEAFNDIPTNFIWGNNATYAQNFNKDGLISSIVANNAPPVNKNYIFDIRDNIKNINDPLDSNKNITATYDNKSRITHYSFGSTGNLYDYTYNTSDDRLTSTDNSFSSNYIYDINTHRLNEITGTTPDIITYDVNGNILTSAGKTYTYNAANRMASSSNGITTTNYLINFSGERVKKTNGANTTWFIYDDMGNVIAEYDQNGDLVNEYIYMDGTLVGLIKNNSLHYVYTDHLGTPRAITDTANNLKWIWENKEAFGKNQPDENISGIPFNFNFRFPGQYYDSETGLNYNINRDYNPNWGRYVQSDPIGLMGGINTYGYVGGNSLSNYDALGLYSSQDLLNDATDWSAGFGDNLSFGLTKQIRTFGNIGSVNECSNFYQGGEYGGISFSIAFGGVLGGIKSSVKYLGPRSVQWSHWIPGRFIKNGKNLKPYLNNRLGKSFIESSLNGNYVTKNLHALTDPYAFQFISQRSKKALSNQYGQIIKNQVWSTTRQQINRIPYWISGTTYGSGSYVNNK